MAASHAIHVVGWVGNSKTILHLHKSQNTPLLPLNILRNRCLQFFLGHKGHKDVPREIENNAYAIYIFFFGGGGGKGKRGVFWDLCKSRIALLHTLPERVLVTTTCPSKTTENRSPCENEQQQQHFKNYKNVHWLYTVKIFELSAVRLQPSNNNNNNNNNSVLPLYHYKKITLDRIKSDKRVSVS